VRRTKLILDSSNIDYIFLAINLQSIAKDHKPTEMNIFIPNSISKLMRKTFALQPNLFKTCLGLLLKLCLLVLTRFTSKFKIVCDEINQAQNLFKGLCCVDCVSQFSCRAISIIYEKHLETHLTSEKFFLIFYDEWASFCKSKI